MRGEVQGGLARLRTGDKTAINRRFAVEVESGAIAPLSF